MIVANGGDVAGDEVAMIFLRGPSAGRDGAALRSLVHFDRVTLQPGTSTTVRYQLKARDLAVPDANGKLVPRVGLWIADLVDVQAGVVSVTAP